jgi:hypothetical protein
MGTLVGKPERKKSLVTPTSMWVDNIKMDLGEIGWDGMSWIGLAQERNQWRDIENAVMRVYLRAAKNSRKLLSGCTTGGLRSSTQLHGVSDYIDYTALNCRMPDEQSLQREFEGSGCSLTQVLCGGQ